MRVRNTKAAHADPPAMKKLDRSKTVLDSDETVAALRKTTALLVLHQDAQRTVFRSPTLRNVCSNPLTLPTQC